MLKKGWEGGAGGGLGLLQKNLFIISNSRQWKYFCGYLNPHTELRKSIPCILFISKKTSQLQKRGVRENAVGSNKFYISEQTFFQKCWRNQTQH